MKKQTKPQYYDVKMIREFLDHLTWELRTCLFELQQQITKPSMETPLNPELLDQLRKHMEKRQCVLLPTMDIDTTGTTESEAHTVVTAISRIEAELRQRQLGHLEAVAGLFEEAMNCAAGPPGKMPIRKIRAVDFLLGENAEES
jgi:hypothetical protein